MPLTDPNRLFPVDKRQRDLARALYDSVAELPIISPHGHCDPVWFAQNERFPNPAELFVVPDHYVFRMLVSQGVPMADLGVCRVNGETGEADPRKIWHHFAKAYPLFRGTPSGMWLDHSLEHVFGVDEVLSAANAWAPNFGVQEYLVLGSLECDALFPADHMMQNGMMYVSDAPGLGVDFDEIEAAKYEYKPGSHPIVRLQDGTMWDY